MVQETGDDDAFASTLAGALVANGVPAITIEAGGACGIVERSINSGKAAILGVLYGLGMMHTEFNSVTPHRRMTTVYDYTNRPLCTSTGIIRFSVTPGASVQAHQELGRVYSAFGSVEETLRAARPGYVLGVSDHARALPGSEVIAIAEFGDTTADQPFSDGPSSPASIH
jgi:predicted deacylase